MLSRILLVFLVLRVATLAGSPAAPRYVGPDTCSLCHKSIAASHSVTAMANTWQGAVTGWLPRDFSANAQEGPRGAFGVSIQRLGEHFLQATALPGKPVQSTPIEAITGGKRHGIGFLTRVSQLDGLDLARPVLVQSRYAWSVAQGKLVLAPGCPEALPKTYRTAFGLALSPEYEKRCLECHGKPNTLGAGAHGGVQCESCHGPGTGHLQALAHGDGRNGIVNPGRLSNHESIEVCGRCHIGLTKFADPQPADLLVANQVTALKRSECFIQSNMGMSCTTCHNPHEDAAGSRARSEQACLTCHTNGSPAIGGHAATCPVNQRDGCLACHMPAADIGPFHLVDHQIRVHPEQKITVARDTPPGFASTLQPVSEYLRIIETQSRESAEQARVRIVAGAAFSRVAAEVSLSHNDGYLGRQEISMLEPGVRAVATRLRKSELSAVAFAGGHWLVLQRMPRDFEWQSAELQKEAARLHAAGDLQGAIQKSQQALLVNPRALQSLQSLARLLAQAGDGQRASQVLDRAHVLYPDDAETAFLAGSVRAQLGGAPDAQRLWRQAIENDGDYLPPYAALGRLLFESGDWNGSREVLERGLRANPLAADLELALGAVLEKKGEREAAAKARALAAAIAP